MRKLIGAVARARSRHRCRCFRCCAGEPAGSRLSNVDTVARTGQDQRVGRFRIEPRELRRGGRVPVHRAETAAGCGARRRRSHEDRRLLVNVETRRPKQPSRMHPAQPDRHHKTGTRSIFLLSSAYPLAPKRSRQCPPRNLTQYLRRHRTPPNFRTAIRQPSRNARTCACWATKNRPAEADRFLPSPVSIPRNFAWRSPRSC